MFLQDIPSQQFLVFDYISLFLYLNQLLLIDNFFSGKYYHLIFFFLFLKNHSIFYFYFQMIYFFFGFYLFVYFLYDIILMAFCFGLLLLVGYFEYDGNNYLDMVFVLYGKIRIILMKFLPYI